MASLFTQTDFPLDEVISALQKDIRRGNEERAMYWSLELIPRFEAYLWRRLCVIVNEDIGIANPTLLLLVPTQRALFMEFREAGRDGSARLVLANTILLLCRSDKSRLADHFQCVVNQERLQPDVSKYMIPDYALDKHTRRGKNMKRGLDHWLDEGCLLNPPADPDPYAERARVLWASPDFSDTDWPKRKRAGKTDDEDNQMELW
jgi:replication-associated recombination protein RarA